MTEANNIATASRGVVGGDILILPADEKAGARLKDADKNDNASEMTEANNIATAPRGVVGGDILLLPAGEKAGARLKDADKNDNANEMTEANNIVTAPRDVVGGDFRPITGGNPRAHVGDRPARYGKKVTTPNSERTQRQNRQRHQWRCRRRYWERQPMVKCCRHLQYQRQAYPSTKTHASSREENYAGGAVHLQPLRQAQQLDF